MSKAGAAYAFVTILWIAAQWRTRFGWVETKRFSGVSMAKK
jgi:hypothetical protein